MQSFPLSRTSDLNRERKRTDMLLYQMMPKQIADALKKNEEVKAEEFDVATIFFSDIVGFTNISSKSSPVQVIVGAVGWSNNKNRGRLLCAVMSNSYKLDEVEVKFMEISKELSPSIEMKLSNKVIYNFCFQVIPELQIQYLRREHSIYLYILTLWIGLFAVISVIVSKYFFK